MLHHNSHNQYSQHILRQHHHHHPAVVKGVEKTWGKGEEEGVRVELEGPWFGGWLKRLGGKGFGWVRGESYRKAGGMEDGWVRREKGDLGWKANVKIAVGGGR